MENLLDSCIIIFVMCDKKKSDGRHVSWIGGKEGGNDTTKRRMELVYSASMLLNNLMENYDNRLRPDFGSACQCEKIHTSSTVHRPFSHRVLVTIIYSWSRRQFSVRIKNYLSVIASCKVVPKKSGARTIDCAMNECVIVWWMFFLFYCIMTDLHFLGIIP